VIGTVLAVVVMFVLPFVAGVWIGHRHRGEAKWQATALRQAQLIDDAIASAAQKTVDGDRTAADLLLLLIQRPSTVGLPSGGEDWQAMADNALAAKETARRRAEAGLYRTRSWRNGGGVI